MKNNTNYLYSKNNIIKKISNNKIYKNEIDIYLYLLDKNITLLSSSRNSSISYHITNEISLYNYLKESKNNSTYKSNIKIVLNELFCFVNKFKSYNFIHGNLHIHNIFLNPNIFSNKNTFVQKQNFYVIDFNHSKIYKKDDIYKSNWDFFTLYVSLKKNFKNDIKHLIYLETLIVNYIDKSNLKYLLNKYVKYLM